MDQVIDTNYLRTPADITALKRPNLEVLLQSSAPGDRFILTDTAVIEQMKNLQWESTSRSSFKIIAKHPQKIWLAKAPGDLMNAELASGQETQDVIDAELTNGFRLLVSEMINGIEGQGMVFAKSQIAAAQADLVQQQLNHAENLKGLNAACEAIKTSLKITPYRRIPDADQKEMVRLHRIKTLAQAAVKTFVELEDKPADLGNSLAAGRGILLRYQIGYHCLGFKWALNNGLGSGSYPAEKATNELLDLDHALVATYFDGILTEEASVREMREDILQILNSNIQFAPAAAEAALKSPNP